MSCRYCVLAAAPLAWWSTEVLANALSDSSLGGFPSTSSYSPFSFCIFPQSTSSSLLPEQMEWGLPSFHRPDTWEVQEFPYLCCHSDDQVLIFPIRGYHGLKDMQLQWGRDAFALCHSTTSLDKWGLSLGARKEGQNLHCHSSWLHWHLQEDHKCSCPCRATPASTRASSQKVWRERQQAWAEEKIPVRSGGDL